MIKIGNKDLESSLGMPVFRNEQVLSGTGVITGLAWEDGSPNLVPPKSS